MVSSGNIPSEIEQSALNGDPEKQHELGLCFLKGEGKGVMQDSSKALEWFGKAAEQGHCDSQCRLGVMYDTGDGIDRDFAKARYWYEKAANQGHPFAQFNLGVIYQRGNGVPQDNLKAKEWYEKAAVQGDPDLQHKLGMLYLHLMKDEEEIIERHTQQRKDLQASPTAVKIKKQKN